MVTDKDGNVTFTDTPPSDQEAVVEAQTVHSPNTSAAVTPAPIDEPDDATATEPISYETLDRESGRGRDDSDGAR